MQARDMAMRRPYPTSLFGFLRMTRAFIRKLIPTLLAAGITALVSAQDGLGLMLGFVIIGMLIWVPYSIWVAAREPEIRTLQLASVFIWIAMVAVVLEIHSIRDNSKRTNAEKIVASAKHFSALNGRCPATLDEIGITRQQLDEEFGRARYWCDNGRFTFYYASSFDVTSTHDYNSESGEWEIID